VGGDLNATSQDVDLAGQFCPGRGYPDEQGKNIAWPIGALHVWAASEVEFFEASGAPLITVWLEVRVLRAHFFGMYITNFVASQCYAAAEKAELSRTARRVGPFGHFLAQRRPFQQSVKRRA